MAFSFIEINDVTVGLCVGKLGTEMDGNLVIAF